MSEIDEIYTCYNMLTQNLDTLLSRCQNDEEKQQLLSQYQQVADQYQLALSKVFNDADADVASLRTQLSTAQGDIECLLGGEEQYANIAPVIGGIVDVLSKLVLRGM